MSEEPLNDFEEEFRKAMEADHAISSGRCAEHENRVEDAPPNNIASDKCITDVFSPDDFIALRYGFDTLHLSYKGEMKPEARTLLAEKKALAQSRHFAYLAQVDSGEHIFSVSDKGRGLCRYLIKDGCFEISLNDAAAPKSPVAYVKVRSSYLARYEPLEVRERLRAILNEFCILEGEEKVSRADLFLDFTYPADVMRLFSYDQIITRGSTIRSYYSGLVLTNWDIGIGADIAARLYNKSLELQKSKQDYIKHLWVQAGWDLKTDVTRVEFQLRRLPLQARNINTIQDLVIKRSELWTYLTTDWMRIIVPEAGDKTRSRRKTLFIWEAIWDGACGALDQPLLKHVSSSTAPNLEYMLRQYCSIAAKIFALYDIRTFKEGMEWQKRELAKLLALHYSRSGVPLDTYLMDSTRNKVREFNLRMNKDAPDNSSPFPLKYTDKGDL